MEGGEGFRWLVLRQTNRDMPCANGPCARCLGTGYGYTDNLVKGFIWNLIPAFKVHSRAGVLSTSIRNLVVEYNRPLKKFDQILEITLDPNTGLPLQPFQVLRSFVLGDASPARGKNGRVEFWKAVVEERSLTDDQEGEKGTGYTHNKNR